MSKKASLYIILFSLIVSLPVILPFFHQGYFPTHDGEWAVVRMAEMFREIRDYQFPARYSGYLNFGYGYPLFNFAYPFPYYLGTGLHLLKFGFVDSVKIIFAVSVPLSAFFMFLASREFWGNKLSGIVSAMLYIYLPYRMVDLYVRGSLGESISFVLFPLILFLILKIPQKNNLVIWSLAAFCYAMLIATHNIMAVYFSLIIVGLIIFLLIFEKEIKFKPYILFILFGLLMSAFFWVPALMEKQYILLSKIPIADRNLYFATLKQLLLPSWGYGAPTELDGFSYQVGLPHVILYILTIAAVIYNFVKFKSEKKTTYLKRALFICLIVVVLSFMLFSKSVFLWKLPFLSEINYPWTLLAPLGFLLSLLAGFLCIRNRVLKYFVFSVSIISIFVFLPYARPQMYFNKGDSYYITNDATTTSSQELMPLWVKQFPNQRPKDKIEGSVVVSKLLYNSKAITFDADLLTGEKIRINTIYYPGWKAFVNGREVKIDYSSKKGVMDVPVRKGENKIKLIFVETPIRLISDTVSLVSFLIIMLLILKHFSSKYISMFIRPANKKTI